MTPIVLTQDNFEAEVLTSKVPVLVDFWAPWCGPCRMLSPVVDEIAENADGFKVGKVNADEEQELCIAYGISSIPTLIVFKNGKVVNKSIGVISEDEIYDLLGL